MGKWSRVITSPTFKGEDYTGKVVNEWTVLELSWYKGAPTYRQFWNCRCQCGRVCEVLAQNITSGRSRGCSKCLGDRQSKNNNPNWKGSGDIPGTYIYRIHGNAKSRGLSVDVIPEDIQQLWEKSGGHCALSGMVIELGSTASLDRIDSSLPYTKGNLQWVHKTVNHMKNNYAESVFIDICRCVADHTKERT